MTEVKAKSKNLIFLAAPMQQHLFPGKAFVVIDNDEIRPLFAPHPKPLTKRLRQQIKKLFAVRARATIPCRIVVMRVDHIP